MVAIAHERTRGSHARNHGRIDARAPGSKIFEPANETLKRIPLSPITIPITAWTQVTKMGKKAAKASRKYAASGKLKNEIQARKKHQQIKRNMERRKSGKPNKKGIEAEERKYLDNGKMGEKKRKDSDGFGASSDEEVSDAETGK